MNDAISNFYKKYPEQAASYEKEHGSRLDYIVNTFGLGDIYGECLADFGGGHGFLFKRLRAQNVMTIFDGAQIQSNSELLCNCEYMSVDLNAEFDYTEPIFDRSFCFEVLEHLENPYRCVCQMKKLTKENGLIYVSVPDFSVTHNTPYPGLIYPHTSFQAFLGQMALPILRYAYYDRPHRAHLWECRNAPWEESVMLFYKDEAKFRGLTPVEATNI